LYHRNFGGGPRAGRVSRLSASPIAITSRPAELAHLWDQGVPGAAQATITGLVFGTVYPRIGAIWPVMVAHAAFDVTAVLMIYWNLEEPIGHLLLHIR
jgi:membrane protease YdiL (CAAX protease family)